MPRLKAAFAPFHASCSRTSSFERVIFHRAARHTQRRAANWSFHQYIETLACLRLRRGIEQSQAAATFCLTQHTVASNDSAGQTQPSSSMNLVSSRCSRSLSPTPTLIPCMVPFFQAEFNAPVVTPYQGRPDSLTEAFLKEDDLGFEDLERIVGGEVAAVHTDPRHLHPNEPRVGLQEISDALIRATNRDADHP